MYLNVLNALKNDKPSGPLGWLNCTSQDTLSTEKYLNPKQLQISCRSGSQKCIVFNSTYMMQIEVKNTDHHHHTKHTKKSKTDSTLSSIKMQNCEPHLSVFLRYMITCDDHTSFGRLVPLSHPTYSLQAQGLRR